MVPLLHQQSFQYAVMNSSETARQMQRWFDEDLPPRHSFPTEEEGLDRKTTGTVLLEQYNEDQLKSAKRPNLVNSPQPAKDPEIELLPLVVCHDAMAVPNCGTLSSTFPLSTEEDMNWLSEFLYFIRSEVVEVFRATRRDVEGRPTNKPIVLGQVGIRCRFCVHLSKRQRVSRSVCFPSSTGKIYQSVTMMVRDHFCKCKAFPQDVRDKFDKLRAKPSQGVIDSKKYWSLSANRVGLIDTHGRGIAINSRSQEATAANALRQNTVVSLHRITEKESFVPLLEPSDRDSTSEYFFLLLNQIERVFMTKEDKVGNRRSMKDDLPGFGCRFCNLVNRKGNCRFFPGRRRTLPKKLHDLHCHLLRCNLCPEDTKLRLGDLLAPKKGIVLQEPPLQKDFMDKIWYILYSKSPTPYLPIPQS